MTISLWQTLPSPTAISHQKQEVLVWEDFCLPDFTCETVCQQVWALKRQWLTRSETPPFSTLGLAAYLDDNPAPPEQGTGHPYKNKALLGFYNRTLSTHFKVLEQIVIRHLEHWLKMPVHIGPDHVAHPGFHIHVPHPLFGLPVASKHIDLQFQKAYGSQAAHHRGVFTLTLPISLPPDAGLMLWTESNQVLHVPYKIGHLYLHSGLHPHQAVLHPKPSQITRICYQGHGIIWEDEAHIYW